MRRKRGLQTRVPRSERDPGRDQDCARRVAPRSRRRSAHRCAARGFARLRFRGRGAARARVRTRVRKPHTAAAQSRRADTYPPRRSRPGDATGQRRARCQVAFEQPPCHRGRLRPHRIAASMHAAADRKIHRYRRFRDAASVLPRLSGGEQATADVLVAAGAQMIEVDGLEKQFGKRHEIKAVAGATFRAEDGEITGLLGPNGAGKTTLLRTLATLIAPDAGSATVDGLDVVRDRYAVRSRIGVLSDARGLYARLTARENVRYYGRLHGLGGAALDARVEALLTQFGLSALGDRRAHGFSQGERMKVAIARALVHDPATILLDEPTNGLDIMSIRSLRDLLRGLRQAGKCILFSTHVMQEVAALCDTVVILGHGRVVAIGSGVELMNRTGRASLEDAFVSLLGSGEGLAA